MSVHDCRSHGDRVGINMAHIIGKEEAGAAYLEKHKISDVFKMLCAEVIFNKPDDHKAYMANVLLEMIKIRNGENNHEKLPVLFTEENLASIFSMLDPTDTGFINKQYKHAMASLGIEYYREQTSNEISFETFKTEAISRLRQAMFLDNHKEPE